MDFELIAGGSAVVVIVAIIEILKSFGLDKKFAPIAAIILGIGFSFGLAYYGGTVQFEAAVRGLIVGLSAVGLYSGTKNIAEKFRSED